MSKTTTDLGSAFSTVIITSTASPSAFPECAHRRLESDSKALIPYGAFPRDCTEDLRLPYSPE